LARLLRVGIDDTDSRRAMCTTYVAAMALQELRRMGYKAGDMPWLVRLNPNCPFKTRGNAAACISVLAEPGDLALIQEKVASVVERWADMECEGTDPGMVLAWEEQAEGLRDVYWGALRGMVSPGDVRLRCSRLGVRLLEWKSGRGIVGAAAAVGADPATLRTYEAIAYRVPEMWGRERLVDEESVLEMDRELGGYTFDNYDYEKSDVRITPHTPCPVLAGVRAVTPEHAERGLRMVRFLEPVDFHIVFKTNQGGDLHYVPAKISDARPLGSYAVWGRVVSRPVVITGGHVLARIGDGEGVLTIAAYQPTGSFRRIVQRLMPGDEVIAYGGLKMKGAVPTLNLEKLAILRLAKAWARAAPICEPCGRKMKSMGRGKGYRCETCGARRPELRPVMVEVERGIREGVYEVCVSARRHLAMPLKLASLLGHDEHRQG